jgi:predicted dehydrogenase
MHRLNWGVLGTGRMARTFANALPQAQSGRLVAVGSRDRAVAQKFAGEFDLRHAYGSYAELLANSDVQAVYICTPHPYHVEWVIRAAQAGKHVLCEKPLGLNVAEAMAAAEACRKHDVLLMEAFMYRCHPQTAKIVSLIRDGALGAVKLVQAFFGFYAAFDAQSRLWAKHLGGGGILDVGCYPVSMVRLIAGASTGDVFCNPVNVTGAAVLHRQTGVDSYAAGTLEFANGMIAQVASAISVPLENAVRIYGTRGWLHVPVPWSPSREGGTTKILLHQDNIQAPQEILVETQEGLFAFEIDAFTASLSRQERDVAQMSVADTLGNMAALDAWREAVGLET